jgi:LPXTG-motif cell wall-anchored protein
VVTLPEPVASIVLVKSVTGVVDTTGDGLIGVGDTVSYAFSVTNTGNVTLAPVTVSDDMLGLTDAACVASLAPRETLPCSTTGSYVITLADSQAGGVLNTATATGVPPAAAELEPVTDTSDAGTTPSGPGTVSTVTTPGSTETPNPTGVTTSVPNDSEDPTEDPTALTLATPVAKIVLWKSISAVADTTGDGWLGAGDTITYTFTVKNTGNVPLAPVTVTDAMLGFTDAACVDTLAAGATGTCVTTASYVITAADVAAGGVANTAVTTGTPPAAYQLANVTDVSDTGTAPGGPGEYGEVTDPDSTETAIPAGVTTSVTNNGSDPTDDPTVLTLTERTPMPNTGSDSVPLVLGGLGLMLAGLVLVLLARRRRKTA